MSTTEARASVDRASERVALLALDPAITEGTLEALSAIVHALEEVLRCAEAGGAAIRTLDAMRLEDRP